MLFLGEAPAAARLKVAGRRYYFWGVLYCAGLIEGGRKRRLMQVCRTSRRGLSYDFRHLMITGLYSRHC